MSSTTLRNVDLEVLSAVTGGADPVYYSGIKNGVEVLCSHDRGKLSCNIGAVDKPVTLKHGFKHTVIMKNMTKGISNEP